MEKNEQKRILITGGNGFIGHHLARKLKSLGNFVRVVDWKKYEYGEIDFCDENLIRDLRNFDSCIEVTKDIDEVYQLAADMGGMGWIQDPTKQYDIRRNSILINLNMVEASRINKIKKYLFSSSACVYPNYKQMTTDVIPLKEEDAYPIDSQDSYGYEKIFTEQLCEESGLNVRIVRFHNIYGPEGTWRGGREKAPAALCRKVIEAIKKGTWEIEIWGDGEQTRSFCYIDDCIKGLQLVMDGAYTKPVNLGRNDMISINQLADVICKIAGVKLKYRHVPGNVGVRGRNSDNSLFKELYGWEPEVSMEEGLKKTYEWIKIQMSQ